MTSQVTRAQRGLAWFSAALLLIAAFSKLATLALALPILERLDPIFLIKNRYVLIGVALAELACMAAVLKSRHVWYKGAILLWLGANFVVYRAALALSGASAPCPCLGSIGAMLGLRSSTTEFLTKSVAVYLVLAGAYLLIRHWKPAKSSSEPPPGTNVVQALSHAIKLP